MKKVFSLIIIFVLLTTFTTIALAGGGMVGQVVDSEYPLWLHENKISKNVITINGVSYAPVRVLGEAMGLDVEFKNNQVFLKNKSKPEVYYYKSKLFEIEPDFKSWFIEQDGNQYVPFDIFKKYYIYETTTINEKQAIVGKITLPGKTEYNLPIIQGNNKYAKDCVIFAKGGTAFIKASELGVTATIKGNEIWIEK